MKSFRSCKNRVVQIPLREHERKSRVVPIPFGKHAHHVNQGQIRPDKSNSESGDSDLICPDLSRRCGLFRAAQLHPPPSPCSHLRPLLKPLWSAAARTVHAKDATVRTTDV